MCENGLTKSEKRVIAAIAIFVICAMVGITSAIIVGSDDQQTEEFAEEIIEKETGLDIDLTPKSKEADKR